MANKKKNISPKDAIREVANKWAELSVDEGVESLINDGRDILEWDAFRMSESDLAKFESSWFDVLERASSDKRYKGMLQSQAVESMQNVAKMMAIGLLSDKVIELQKEEQLRLRKENEQLAFESVQKLTRMRDLVVHGTEFEDVFQELSQLIELEEDRSNQIFYDAWNVFRHAWSNLMYEMLIQAHVSTGDFIRVYNDASDRLLPTIGKAFRDHPMLPLWMDEVPIGIGAFLSHFSMVCVKTNVRYIEDYFDEPGVKIMEEVINRMDLQSLYGKNGNHNFYLDKLMGYTTEICEIRIQCTAAHLLAKAFQIGERRGINILEKFLDD